MDAHKNSIKVAILPKRPTFSVASASAFNRNRTARLRGRFRGEDNDKLESFHTNA